MPRKFVVDSKEKDFFDTGEDESYTGEDESYTGEDESYTGEDELYTGEDESDTGEDISHNGEDDDPMFDEHIWNTSEVEEGDEDLIVIDEDQLGNNAGFDFESQYTGQDVAHFDPNEFLTAMFDQSNGSQTGGIAVKQEDLGDWEDDGVGTLAQVKIEAPAVKKKKLTGDDEALIKEILNENYIFEVSPYLIFIRIPYFGVLEDAYDDATVNLEAYKGKKNPYNQKLDTIQKHFAKVDSKPAELALWQVISDCVNAKNGHLDNTMKDKRDWVEHSGIVCRNAAPYYDPKLVLEAFMVNKLWKKIKTVDEFHAQFPHLFDFKERPKLKHTGDKKIPAKTPAKKPVKTHAKKPVAKTPVVKKLAKTPAAKTQAKKTAKVSAKKATGVKKEIKEEPEELPIALRRSHRQSKPNPRYYGYDLS